MKKFLLSLMTIMSLVWTNSFAQTPELGTETNPFLIENLARRRIRSSSRTRTN